MGKIKDLTIKIDDIIEDIYVLGNFHSPDTFAELVYKRMKEADINVAYMDYVDYKIKWCLEWM